MRATESRNRSNQSQSTVQIQAPYGNLAARSAELGNNIILFANQRIGGRPDFRSERERYKDWYIKNDGLFHAWFGRDVELISKELSDRAIEDQKLDDLIGQLDRYFENRQKHIQDAINLPEGYYMSIEDIDEIGEKFKFLATQVPR